MVKQMTVCALVAASALVGCSTIDQPGGRLYEALLPAQNVGDSVECASGCKSEWERAQLWLSRHSKWKLQSVTDVVLTTYNPVNSEVSYGFEVTREPVSEGRYVVRMALQCGNMLGCDPSPVSVRNAFYYYVKTGQDLLAGQAYMSSIR
jgi:hypothetical protein